MPQDIFCFASRKFCFVYQIIEEERRRAWNQENKGRGEGNIVFEGMVFYLFISLGFTPNNSKNTLLK